MHSACILVHHGDRAQGGLPSLRCRGLGAGEHLAEKAKLEWCIAPPVVQVTACKQQVFVRGTKTHLATIASPWQCLHRSSPSRPRVGDGRPSAVFCAALTGRFQTSGAQLSTIPAAILCVTSSCLVLEDNFENRLHAGFANFAANVARSFACIALRGHRHHCEHGASIACARFCPYCAPSRRCMWEPGIKRCRASVIIAGTSRSSTP